MLSAGLLVASLLYWGSNSDAPAKTMISPAKIIRGRQRKCQQHTYATELFRDISHKTYSHSSPNNHKYPHSLFSGSVTAATGQRRQEPMPGTRQKNSLKAPFYTAPSPAFDFAFTKPAFSATVTQASFLIFEEVLFWTNQSYFCLLAETGLQAGQHVFRNMQYPFFLFNRHIDLYNSLSQILKSSYRVLFT